MRCLSFVLFFAVFGWDLDTSLFGQFRPPVDFEMRLSGTFGEIRTNHFHTGIDIKSPNGHVGHPIRSIYDGYIERIKVEKGGYGYSLLIRHPNGYASLYAHLDRFVPKLDSFVLSKQYSDRLFELELSLSDSLFRVKKGEIIGYLGNSGYSFGPHLHFELRNTKSGNPVNPLLFFDSIRDRKPPHAAYLYVYVFDEKDDIIYREKIKCIKRNGKYTLGTDSLDLPGRRVGFALELVDLAQNTHNKNGIYSLDMFLGDQLKYQLRFDSLNFRYRTLMNVQIDYEAKRVEKKNAYRCFLFNSGYPYINKVLKDKGILTLDTGQVYPVLFYIRDINGNTSELHFLVSNSGRLLPPDKAQKHSVRLSYQRETVIDFGPMRVFFPENSFERDVDLFIDSMADYSNCSVSASYHIGDATIPLLRPMRLSFAIDHVDSSLYKKLLVARCEDGKYLNCGGTLEDQSMWVDVSQSGEYQLMIDSTAPSIEPLIWDRNWTNMKKLRFRIDDNFGVAGQAEGLKIQSSIDGRWILWRYDLKSKTIDYLMDLDLEPGVHHFELQVEDHSGNKRSFVRKIVIDH